MTGKDEGAEQPGIREQGRQGRQGRQGLLGKPCRALFSVGEGAHTEVMGKRGLEYGAGVSGERGWRWRERETTCSIFQAGGKEMQVGAGKDPAYLRHSSWSLFF